MQMNQTVRQQALPRPQHAAPARIGRQALIVRRPTPHPTPSALAPWDDRLVRVRLARGFDEREEREAVVVVGGRGGDKEMRWEVDDRGVLRSVGAPDGRLEVEEDCRSNGREFGRIR
jgi:hypothetical protein